MEDIKTRLGLYRERCARLKVMEVKITYVEHKLSEIDPDERAPYEPKSVPGGKAQSYNDMPRNQVLYGTLEGIEGFDPSLEISEILKRAKDIAMQLALNINELEAAMTGLDTKELLVVMQTYMDGVPWQDISAKIHDEYGVCPSEFWICQTRKKALKKLDKCLGQAK